MPRVRNPTACRPCHPGPEPQRSQMARTWLRLWRLPLAHTWVFQYVVSSPLGEPAALQSNTLISPPLRLPAFRAGAPPSTCCSSPEPRGRPCFLCLTLEPSPLPSSPGTGQAPWVPLLAESFFGFCWQHPRSPAGVLKKDGPLVFPHSVWRWVKKEQEGVRLLPEGCRSSVLWDPLSLAAAAGRRPVRCSLLVALQPPALTQLLVRGSRLCHCRV